MLDLLFCGEFLLHIHCCVRFYVGSFSYTSRVGFKFFLSGEFHLHNPCWFLFLLGEFLLHTPCWVQFYQGSFSDTSRAGFTFIWGVSLTHPVLASFYFIYIYGEFLLHIPCWIYFSVGSFSYTSIAVFVFMWGVSLTHPELAWFFSCFLLGSFSCKSCSVFFFFFFFFFLLGDFLLHIPCWVHFYRGCFSYTYLQTRGCLLAFFFLNLESLSYTSIADFVFMWGISLTRPVLPSFLSGRDSLTHPVLASFFNFSFFIWGIAIAHPVLVSFFYFLLGEFLLHISCWVHFYRGSFSYTSRSGFIFIWEVSLTHLVLASFLFFCLFLSGEFLLHIPCWIYFYVGCFA